jgi:hypothetical protein
MSFWHFLWEMLVVFAFVAFVIVFFHVVVDLFRSRDISGWGKAGWALILIIFPILGVLVYLIVRGDGMADRAFQSQVAADANQLINAAGRAPTDQMTQAKQLPDQGPITTEAHLAGRPVRFAYPAKPEDTAPPGEKYHRFRWKLTLADGTDAFATIRIYGTAVELAQTEPDNCDPDVATAVATNGRSVIEEEVLGRDDPPLDWVVHVNVILPDDATPPD